jgi:hypothetical protein
MLAMRPASSGICASAAKLRLDLPDGFGRPGGMDEDEEELLVHLCTRIGVIMEDASFVALTIRGTKAAEREAALEQITAAGKKLAALTCAVSALTSAPESNNR